MRAILLIVVGITKFIFKGLVVIANALLCRCY